MRFTPQRSHVNIAFIAMLALAHHAFGEVTRVGSDVLADNTLFITSIDSSAPSTTQSDWESPVDVHCVGYQNTSHLMTIDTQGVCAELFETEDAFAAQTYNSQTPNQFEVLKLNYLNTHQILQSKLDNLDDQADSIHNTSMNSYR